MPDRTPVVAGRFYPADRQTIINFLSALSAQFADTAPRKSPFLFMLPHAGWIFSGSTVYATLADMKLPDKLVILCPNHTGQGHPLGVWPNGKWLTPLGTVSVDEEFASALCASGLLCSDTASHLREHSIEVELPFLQYLRPNNPPAIVPVCIGTQEPAILQAAGLILASCLTKAQAASQATYGILVSSDMNHYENEAVTRDKDILAINQICAESPEGLLSCCRKNNISMCGAGPMAMALFALNALRKTTTGAHAPILVRHDTSAKTAHDNEHVVGYAGMQLFL